MNQVIKTLQQLGIALFSFHLISVPGRRSGLLRTTPVSPFSVDGQRYLVSFGQTEWVKNARESGWGILARGRRRSKVALVEVRPPESEFIVREFPLKIPAGVQFFVRLGLVEQPAGPDQFQAAADRLALFRVDPIQDESRWGGSTLGLALDSDPAARLPPMEVSHGEPAIAGRAARALASSGAIMRFLMQPRDLGHAEACDFLAGNPVELASPAYVAAVQRAVEPDSPNYYRYGPPWRPAVEAVTSALAGRLGLELVPEDVFLTRGASSGLLLLLRLLLDPGDEVMMMSPPWFFYEAMVLAESAEPVKVPLTSGTFDLDLPEIERAITPRTRAVIVNSPHNPSGRIYPEDQLRGLSDILERASAQNRRRIYLLSDEAYARILFDSRVMITPARFYPATFMLHSYSKTLLAPSQRAGYLAMSPAMPERELVRRALMLGSLSAGAIPDTSMQHAMPELERQIIDLAAVERRRDRMVAAMRDQGYSVESPAGGFYLFPRSPIPDAVEFCGWLDERHVYTLPGEAFERPGYFRISLTATDEMVERALPVLAEAIRTFSTGVS